SPLRPRCPSVFCWTRRRHSSRASPARRITWKGSMTATASGTSSAAAVLKPVKGVHRDHLQALAPGGVSFGEPLLEGLLGAAFDHVQQPGRTGALADGGQGR